MRSLQQRRVHRPVIAMTNKPMLSVERGLLERVVDNRYREKENISIARHEALWELRALLDKPACAICRDLGDICMECEAAAQRQCVPVAEVEVVEGDSPHVHLYQDVPDGTKLYAEQPAPVADSTTSDKYKAELYDEVWQLARSMGYANVSDALAKLETTVMPGSEDFSHMSTIELRGYHAGWHAACMRDRAAGKPAPAEADLSDDAMSKVISLYASGLATRHQKEPGFALNAMRQAVKSCLTN